MCIFGMYQDVLQEVSNFIEKVIQGGITWKYQSRSWQDRTDLERHWSNISLCFLYNLRRYWHKCYCGVAFSCIINRSLVMKDHYKYVKWVICIDMWIDYYSKHEGTIKSISRYNKYTLLILFYSCFVCLLRVFLPLNNFLLIWTRQRWRAANLDLCWALMAIEQIWFLLRFTPTQIR